MRYLRVEVLKMKKISEIFKKKKDEDEIEEGDLIDEVVDDISYFYEDKTPKKADRWYSRFLNFRNILIGLAIFVVGVTCVGFYVNSIYFKDGKDKTYLTEDVQKEIYFWDTTHKALDFANEAQITFKRAFDNLEMRSSSPLIYEIGTGDLTRLNNLYSEADKYFNELTRIEYYPSVLDEYKGEYEFENENPRSPWYFVDRLKEFYSNSSGSETLSWINPIYLAFTKDSTIDQIDYDLIESKLETYSSKINELIKISKTAECTSGYVYASEICE